MSKKNNKGFTLIELIMVIVILGILAATVVPKFFDFTTKAHESNKEAVIGSIRAALNLYAANELVQGNSRKFPPSSTLSLTAILDEVPIDWSVVNDGANNVDTIKYAGDGTEWVYLTTTPHKSYTITEQP